MTEREPYSVSFKLLGLPTPERNARRNRFRAREEKRGWHSAVAFAVLGRAPPIPLMRARVIFTRHSSVRPDPTNLVESWKAVEDGLVRARILANDKAENYVGNAPTYEWEPAPSGRGFITVHVEEETPYHGGSKEKEEDHDEEAGSDHDHGPEHREERGT